MSEDKTTRYLTTTGPEGEEVRVPVAEVVGRSDGPTLLVIAGVHGSEYDGIEAVKRFHAELDPAALSGRVVTVPCLSVPAFYGLAMHVNPIDGENPGRAAPGRPDGSHTERMIHLVWSEYGADADFVIDVHGGDLEEELVDYTQIDTCGDARIDEAGEALARAMDMRFYVRRPGPDREPGSAGSFLQIAPEQGIPSVLAEAGSHGVLDPECVQIHLKGLRNAAKHLGMLDGEREVANPDPLVLHGFGGVPAPVDGFWYPEVVKGETIHVGQRLGVMRDFFDEELAVVTSPVDAAILGVMTIPPRRKGDMLLGYGDLG
jgi:predicted deacylase